MELTNNKRSRCMKKVFKYLASPLSILLFVASANASLMLEFINPTDTAAPDKSIEVWVRLSTDMDFYFDSTDPDGDLTFGNLNDFGVDAPKQSFFGGANNGAGERLDIVDFSRVFISHSFLCTGSFTYGGCTKEGNIYHFTFNPTVTNQIDFTPSFSLFAGQSVDYLFGTFDPLNGGAMPDFYEFFGAGLSVGFESVGVDSLGVRHTN